MNGKWVAGFIVIAAILFGGALYYNQEYAFYDRVSADASAQDIVATTFTGERRNLARRRVRGRGRTNLADQVPRLLLHTALHGDDDRNLCSL